MANEADGDLQQRWNELVESIRRQIESSGRDPNAAFRSNWENRKLGFLLDGYEPPGTFHTLQISDEILRAGRFDGLARVLIDDWNIAREEDTVRRAAEEPPKP